MTAAIQRPLKGARISSFYPVKTLPPISALDSAFQLQEYISLLIRLDVHDVEKIVAIPGKDQNEGNENGGTKGDDKDADKEAAGGVNVDPACWVYEHLRRVAQDLSHPLITMLQQECTRSSCPEMKAGEWLYLCVAHGNEGAMEQCCAIDYILHTLDSATALLNSPRAFPSRLSVPSTSHRHFTSLCRRLGRIFAHAYFHHREVFEQAEAESSLYARFLALVKYFDLVPLEFLVIPPRMEGGRADPVEPPRLMGASLDPRRDAGPAEGGASWPGAQDGLQRNDRGKSPPGPAGQTRNESPRKFGRARTDTMVYSEAFSVAEELAKSDLSEVDLDREIAAERAAAAEPVPESVPVPEPSYAPTIVRIPTSPPLAPAAEPASQPVPPFPERVSETQAEPTSSESAAEDAVEDESSVAAPTAEAPPAESQETSEEVSASPAEEPEATIAEEVLEPAAEPSEEPDAVVEAKEETIADGIVPAEEPAPPTESSQASVEAAPEPPQELEPTSEPAAEPPTEAAEEHAPTEAEETKESPEAEDVPTDTPAIATDATETARADAEAEGGKEEQTSGAAEDAAAAES